MVTGKRPDLFCPAQRAQPQQPRRLRAHARGITGHAQRHEHPKHDGRQGDGSPAAGRELRYQRGYSSERDTGGGKGASEGERTGGGKSLRGQYCYEQGSDEQVCADGDYDRCGELRVLADSARAQQFGAAGFLLAASVPYDGDDAENPEQQRTGNTHPPCGERSDAVVEQRPVDGRHGRIAANGRGEFGPRLRSRVRGGEGRRRRGHEPGECDDPDRQHDSVAAQDQTDRDTHASDAVHRTPPAVVRCVPGAATSSR
jgi:hypothetical protein